MNESQIVAKLSKKEGISLREAKSLVRSVLSGITVGLEGDREFSHRHLGRLFVVKRHAHTGRNPKTGESVSIPQKYTVRFKASASFKRELNRGK